VCVSLSLSISVLCLFGGAVPSTAAVVRACLISLLQCATESLRLALTEPTDAERHTAVAATYIYRLFHVVGGEFQG